MNPRHTATAALIGAGTALATLYAIALHRVLTGPPIDFTPDEDDDDEARELIARWAHPATPPTVNPPRGRHR